MAPIYRDFPGKAFQPVSGGLLPWIQQNDSIHEKSTGLTPKRFMATASHRGALSGKALYRKAGQTGRQPCVFPDKGSLRNGRKFGEGLEENGFLIFSAIGHNQDFFLRVIRNH
jgi:hypothetical protein